MADTFLSAESDEIADSTSFSATALVGFLLALVGIFAIQYIHTMPLAIIGFVLGAFNLLMAKRFNLSNSARVLAFLAVTIGVTTTSYGLFHRWLEYDYDLAQARRISEMYLENLSKGEDDKVNFLVGFPTDAGGGDDEGMGGIEIKEAPTRRAMKRLQTDPAHVEIRTRKTPPKWVFVAFEGDTEAGAMGHSYKLTYRDEGQTNPPSYWIYPRKNTSKYDRSKKVVNWFVDKLEPVQKQ